MVVRFGGRFTHKSVRFDGGLLIGVTDRDPAWGFTCRRRLWCSKPSTSSKLSTLWEGRTIRLVKAMLTATTFLLTSRRRASRGLDGPAFARAVCDSYIAESALTVLITIDRRR
jgi:hypothetical protein